MRAYPLPSLYEVDVLSNLVCSGPDVRIVHRTNYIVGNECHDVAVACLDNRVYATCAGIERLVCKRLAEVIVVAVDIHQYIVSIIALEVDWTGQSYTAVATEGSYDVVTIL